MSELPKIKFSSCKDGDYLLTKDLCTILKVIKLTDLSKFNNDYYKDINNGQYLILQCYYSNNNSFIKGQIIDDYFDSEFFGAFSEKFANGLISNNLLRG